MRRIIFSIFSDNVNLDHKSVNDYKISQFKKYKQKLIDCKQKYADFCHADFILHDVNIVDYNKIQFEKILLYEKYAAEYDEIMYLDFDVIPTHRAPNIFESFDMNTICMYPLKRDLHLIDLKTAIDRDWLDNQNVFNKTCAKKAMLLLDDINGNDLLYNTGVVVSNSEAAKNIQFEYRLDEMNLLLDEAKEDSLYPIEISKNFYYNNEVYMSYLVERYDIPHTDLSMAWNFIIDEFQPDPVDSAYFIHYVNKDFHKSL